MIARTLAMMCALAANAYGGRDLGIVVTGEDAHKAALLAEAEDWSRAHGFDVTTTPLPTAGLDTLVDCFVLEDRACANEVVATQATTGELVHVQAQSTGSVVQIDVTWFSKGNPPEHDIGACTSCDASAARRSLHKLLDALGKRVRPASSGSARPTVATATVPAPASPPPAVASVAGPNLAPSERVVEAGPSTSRRWHAGAWVGAELPRGRLDPGTLVAARGSYRLDTDATWVVHVTVDWVRTGSNGTALLSPALFPRSMGDLDQTSDLVTIAAGASARVTRIGRMSVYAGLEAGVQDSRARLVAYGMSRVESGVGPAATAEVSVVGPAGPITWRALLGWREARRDLGAASTYGETTTSGGLVAVGFDW